MKRSTLSLLVVLSLIFVTYHPSVQAECSTNGTVGSDGTPGNDTIICDNNPNGGPNEGVGGQGGSDTITIEVGSIVSVVAGDGQGSSGGVSSGDPNVIGAPAADTIVIAGNVGTVYGDFNGAHIDGADDSITITGTGHVSSVVGDEVGGAMANTGLHLGNDTIVVETGAVVDNAVSGDVATDLNADVGLDGNDNITINGTVGSVRGQVGNDTITIGGTVKNEVDGGVGDDKVTLNDGANGGADGTLTVNGGNGNDTLTFAFTISSEADYNALAAMIAGNVQNGSIAINGQTIVWSSFEQLVNALIANFSLGSKVTFGDYRLNGNDAGASALAYCTGSGVQILGVDPTSAQGSEAFTVSTAQIQTALAEAQAGNTNVEIANGDGINLSVTPDGKLVVTAPDISDTAKTYHFSFDASVCGIS